MWSLIRQRLAEFIRKPGQASKPPALLHIFNLPTKKKEAHWIDAILLRIVGGAFGLLLLVGASVKDGNVPCAVFGMLMLCIALFARSKNVENWFGGL